MEKVRRESSQTTLYRAFQSYFPNAEMEINKLRVETSKLEKNLSDRKKELGETDAEITGKRNVVEELDSQMRARDKHFLQPTYYPSFMTKACTRKKWGKGYPCSCV